MKRLWIAASLLLAVTASAQWQTVLTDDNTIWSANTQASSVKLDLLRRAGEESEFVRVPGTEDQGTESHAQIAYDTASRTLFVMWRHDDEVRVMRYSEGVWAGPLRITGGAAFEGLQFALTRSSGVTLLHAIWWAGETAEYALVAFEGGELLSKVVVPLDELAGVKAVSSEPEDTGNAAHPPLAMARAGEGVEVAYGAPRSTAITRVTIKPEKVGGDARMWRPLGRSGRRTDPSNFASSTSAPVQSFIIEGKVVLYTPDAKFRFVVLENGKWTPIRMLALDDRVTSETVLRELRRSVLELSADDAPASQ